ncbi:hypothetical protein AMECASPLE_039542 [Ameca splendens]|uniref:ZP domain-containing protein n=1 Tax=Ameca splendens TaxID=208324 RepID=A0ABV0YW69_9TELE
MRAGLNGWKKPSNWDFPHQHCNLQLKEPTCRGQIDKQTHMVTFSFNSDNLCGTEITNNNSQVIYKNTIMSQNLSSGGITHQDQVYIDFSCIQTQPDIQTAVFRMKSSSVVQVISSGPWRYSLTMKAYTDPGRTQAVYSNTEVRLNQKIWVELDTDGLDEKLVAVVTDSCWATDQASPTGGRKYYLIKNGCDCCLRFSHDNLSNLSGLNIELSLFSCL